MPVNKDCITKAEYNHVIDVATAYKDKLETFRDVLAQNNIDFNEIKKLKSIEKWKWGIIGAILGIVTGASVGIGLGVSIGR